MRNIPTDLLRALVTVIDLKGYTRAGEQLGRAQPTVSLQLKRLQELIGVTLLERAAGVTRLTEAGEVCAAYARRILSLHDEMMHRLVAQGAGNRLRIGLPNDYADHFLPVFLGRVEAEALDMRFEVICDISVNLMRDLREGTLDLALAMAQEALPDGAVLHWPERLCWVGVAGREPKSAGQPLALVAAPEGCTYRRAMLSALQREGRQGEIVYTTPSLTGIEAAIRAGFGITAMAERLVPSGLIALSEMPSLPDANAGLYLNPRAQGGQIRLLVAMLGDVLSPRPAAGPAAAFGGTA
jgi:DNA-binding transcriptional LysR family regulator